MFNAAWGFTMKNKKIFKHAAIGTFLLTLSAGFLINYNLQKHYKKGDFMPEENAYFASEIKEGGTIKAKKYVTPSDNKYSSQKTRSMGSEFIGNIESVWDTYTGAGTKIAIIDDGFDVDHPEYKRSDNSSAILPESRHYYINDEETAVVFDELSSSPNCLAEDWEAVGYDDDNNLVYGWATHGTATSTTAAAPMGNDGGVGIAPDADILALKIDFSFGAIEEAIYYAIEQGVDVINMSLGAYSENFTDGWGDKQTGSSSVRSYLEDACKAAYDAGVIVVAAAGNEATWHKSYPACNYKVVGVGAIGDWDNKGNANKLAEFSNYVSTTQTGEINVDILAPGYVYTAEQTYNKSSDMNSSTAPSKHGHTWNDTQGTSFSSPIVAGAACLWKQKNPTGTPDQFLSDLQSTADGIGYYADKMVEVSGWYSDLTDVGPSNITNGRLNVSRLLGTEAYVNLDKTNMYLLKDHTEQIQITSSNGNITYKSNNTNVATVSSTGLVTAVGAGNTSITVTATVGTQKATANVNVTVQDIVEATSLTFSQNPISIEVGETYNAEPLITLTPSGASRYFLFESQNPSIATVDEDTGEITGVAEGTATIYATAIYGSGEDYLTVNVTAKTAPTSWNKITSSSELEDGDYLIVYETGSKAFNGGRTSLDATNNYVSVSISNNKINYSSDTEAAKFTITELSNGYSIESASGYYIGRDSGSNGMDTSTSTVYVNGITISSGLATIVGTGGKQLLFNTATDQQRFRYNSATTSNISLYKADGGSTPTPPTPSKTLSSISISGQQTEFTTGDPFVFGGTVTAHYSDESSSDVTASAEFSGYNMNTAGQQTVTVSYTEGTTETTTYNITVSDPVVPPTPQEDSYTITFKTGSGDGTTMSTSTEESDYLSAGADYISSIGNVDKTYYAGSNGLKLGASSSAGTLTLNLESQYQVRVTTIVVNAKLYNASKAATLKVNSSTAQSVTSSFGDLEFTINGTIESISLESSKYIWVSGITVNCEAVADKVVKSLTATYSGGSLYVGQSLDESKVTVTAKYTDSVKYPDAVLPSSDYSFSGFDGTSAGNKAVTVTYTGTLETATSPLTTTFNVTVIEDTITSIEASVTKNYHPGETISKADITVTVTYVSSKVEHPTNFTFANDGYQFTYADAASDGANTNKTFNNAVTYGGSSCSLTVVVSRNAYEQIVGATDTITRSTTGKTGTTYGDWSDKVGDSGSIYAGNSAGGNSSIQLRAEKSSGIIMTASAGNVKTIKVTWNSNTADGRVLQIYGKNSAYSSSSELYNSSTQGTLLGTIVYGTSDTLEISGSYAYIGIRSGSGALYLTDIKLTFSSDETATNVANYIMYEDTNNQCLTKLDNAISYFENMSKEERNTFMTSDDYVIATARERLQAWLANQEKQISIVDGDYVISNNYSTLSTFTDSDNEVMTIVVTASFLAISLLTCVYLLRKKRKLI